MLLLHFAAWLHLTYQHTSAALSVGNDCRVINPSTGRTPHSQL
jgi:hypothetical protein